jgi:flagellin-like protein
MNYRKFRKNAKALSPVVASIILIAVTVAVSVVVAAWMGGMTIGLMGSAEQVSITNIAFTAPDQISVMVRNAGGTDSSITDAFINGVALATPTSAAPVTVAKSTSVTIPLTAPANLTSGTSYTIKLITAKGTSVVNIATYSS